MMYRLFLIAWCIPCCMSVCTFPTDLVGDWYSTSFGTLTFTSDSFTGVTPMSVSPLTFSCHELDGTKYIVKASTTIFFDLSFDIFLCMNLEKISPIKYAYTLDSDWSQEFGIRMYSVVSDSVAVTSSMACNLAYTMHAGEYELLVLKANVSDAIIPCPSALRSHFNVTEMVSSSTTCNDSDTYLDGQTDNTQLAFNYSTCAANIAFNAGGTLYCLYYTSDSNIYLTTFNNDSTTDEVTKFRFTCLTFNKNGDSLSATEYPHVCHPNQTATLVDAPGLTYKMTDTSYSASDDINVGLIVGLIIAALVIIALIALLVYFMICRKKPKRKAKQKKLSITQYSANVKKAGHLTGIDKTGGETNKVVSDLVKGGRLSQQVSHYKPAKKEKWQDKWEKKMRPKKAVQQTPIVSESPEPPAYRKMKRRNKTSNLETAQATTMTASLPSKLDLCEANVATTGMLEGKSSSARLPLNEHAVNIDSDGEAASPRLARFSQESFSTTRIPDSTGKFGGTKEAKSAESVLPPVKTPRLQTIDESSISREGSAVAKTSEKDIKPKASKVVPSFIDSAPPPDVRSLITDGGISRSTLSAKAVVLDNEPNGTARPISRMTGSNTSIFDDPTWLEINANLEPDKVFARKANLLPGLPPKEKEWFTKGNKHLLSSITRSDIEFNPNNRTKTVIGINSKGLTKVRKQIEEKKKKRKRVSKSTIIHTKPA